MTTGAFSALHDRLVEEGYGYLFAKLASDFDGVPGAMKYAFLMHEIAVRESAELHLLICDTLLYFDTFFVYIWPVLRWHLLRALAVAPESVDVLQWITSTFGDGHPDSPFTPEELSGFDARLDVLLRGGRKPRWVVGRGGGWPPA